MTTTLGDGVQLGLIGTVANAVGAPEAAFRLLLTLIAGYPIAAIYRNYIVNRTSKTQHHIFFVSCGFFLCFFNYGIDTYHSLLGILTTYLLMRLLHNVPKYLIAINFTFHMVYLLIGYYYTESNDYDILWTMPHCVLVLRMIGFGFDVADGHKFPDNLSKDQKETALKELPNLLELFAFAYFPCSFIVGPQFPFSRYKRFINGEFCQHQGAIETGVKRMLVGVLYLLIRQIGAAKLPDSYFLTEEYANEPFFWRLFYLGLWGKLSLYKYISCWLLTEGALMCIGFSYAGKTSDGKDDWFGCSNVKLLLLEAGYTMQDYVHSFNVNTNHWVAQYVYKRLKFLNNRTISYSAALAFLAVWHGFHSGYYMAFLIEYLIVTTEKQVENVYKNSILPKYGYILNDSAIYNSFVVVILKTYNIVYMGWCLIPFIHLSYSRWMKVCGAVNYFGFIYMAIWFGMHQWYLYNKRVNASTLKGNANYNSNSNTLKKEN